MRSLVPTLFSLTAIAAAAEGPAPVADTRPERSPEASTGTPLVITATRLDEEPWLQPYAMQRLERDDLDRTNARTLTDRLNYQPGVYVQRTAPNQASPYIRGLTGEQTLLLFDGIRYNHAAMRPGPNQYLAMIPDEAVGRVDVILGSSSTVTGSDGLTGAIDVGLAHAGREATTPLSPFAGTRYSSAEGGSAYAGIDGRSADFAYSAELSQADYHDLRGGKDAGDHLFGDAAGSRVIPNSGYRQLAFGGRVAYEGLDQHHLELAFGYTRQDEAPRPDGYAENSGNANRISRMLDPQEFRYVHVRDRWTLDGAIDSVQTTTWYHRHDERQVREDISGSRYRERINDDRIDTLGIDLQLGSQIGDQHDLTYGTTLYQDTTMNDARRRRSPTADPDLAVIDQTGATNPGTTSIPDDSTYRGLAFFVQDSWQFRPQWSLLGGLRYSRTDWQATITDDRPGFDSLDGISGNNAATFAQEVAGDSAAVTASLRLGWQVNTEVFTFAGVSQAFRAPNLTNLVGVRDRGSSSSGGNGPQTEGNLDLDPETSITTETGIRWQRDRDQLALNVYYTALRDLIQVAYIDVDLDGDIDANDRALSVNSARGWLAGGEVSGDLALPTTGLLADTYRFAVVSTLSYSRGRSDEPLPSASGGSTSEYISRANLLFGTGGLKLEHDSGWWTMARARFQAGYNHVNPADGGDTRHTTFAAKDGPAGAMPGFVVYDVLVGYQEPSGKYSMTGSIENCFDRSYRPVGSGTDGAGLNAVVSLHTRF